MPINHHGRCIVMLRPIYDYFLSVRDGFSNCDGSSSDAAAPDFWSALGGECRIRNCGWMPMDLQSLT